MGESLGILFASIVMYIHAAVEVAALPTIVPLLSVLCVVGSGSLFIATMDNGGDEK